MDDALLPLDISVERPSESLLELGPPHVGWFFACIKECLQDLIRFTDIDCVDADTLVVLGQTLKGFAPVVNSR